MSHDAFWQALMAVHATRPGATGQGAVSRWTRADTLACLQSWAAEEGRPPQSSELGPGYQLPGYPTLVRLWGSLAAAWAALGWPYRPQRQRATLQAAPNRLCLHCEQSFWSPDTRAIRLCAPCKAREDWHEGSGDWITGAVVSERCEDASDWWEAD